MNKTSFNPKRTLIHFSVASFLAGAGLINSQATEIPDTALYQEPYRNQLQYAPAQNWMNDPNGLVYHHDEYHLFYQYNPLGNRWGNMSWGHAVSQDLVHWEELPVALSAKHDNEGNITESFFSGSTVVDVHNTTGFGTPENPAMVAIYTNVYHTAKRLEDGLKIEPDTQAQSIAYSLDDGRTWRQYEGNPVLPQPPDIYQDQFKNFRDPKVMWYEPEQKWVMTVVLPQKQKVLFYTSNNLKHWDYMSEFGPENGLGGIWECPDLFEIPLEGTETTKWVLTINMNPGAPAGGSGTQYFVGEFDGQRFIADKNNLYTNDANDDAELIPDGDFEFSVPYNTQGWQATGDFTTALPEYMAVDSNTKNFHGERVLQTFLTAKGDSATGTITSPQFTINKNFISLLVAGGAHPHIDQNRQTGVSESEPLESESAETTVNLIVDGKTMARATGSNSGLLNWHNWHVAELKGKTAQIKIIDSHTGGWGHLLVDHIVQSDQPKQVANWADYGPDFYAAVTWNNTPIDKKVWIGWLNDWLYAEEIPTAPWRSSQTFARQLALREINGKLMLTQQPVENLTQLRGNPLFELQQNTTLLPDQSLFVTPLQAKVYEISTDLIPGANTGTIVFELRKGENGQQTVLSYDVKNQQLSLDRRSAGADSFSERFSGVHTAPLLLADGKLSLRIIVDTASVTVFANDGEVVITEQIFPDPASQGLDVFVTQDAVEVLSFTLWPLASIWE